MSRIDRRRVLTSLAGGAAVTGVAPKIPTAALAALDLGQPCKRAERHEGWLIARQRCERAAEPIIDFWSMPWADIHYAIHLPPQVARAVISYEDFGKPVDTAQNPVDIFTRTSVHYLREWIDPAKLDRFTVNSDCPVESFSSLLTPLIGERSTTSRTAIVALDSLAPGPAQRSWAQILPAFAGCYDSVIGISHFEQRGSCQARSYCNQVLGEDYFDQAFLEPSAMCDAVIVTSAGLIETDAGLCPSASTENLVGELMRRLGHALLDQNILGRIVGTAGTKNPRPRYFALGSATLNAPFEPLLHLQMMLDRQSAFVSASFAPLAADELPLFIVTSEEYDSRLWSGTRDVLAKAAAMSGYRNDREMFATAQAPRYQADARWPGAIDLIALWPFKLDLQVGV